MAIQRMSSRQLMDVFDQAEESMSVLRSDINDVKQEVNRRLAILSNIAEFSTESITRLNELTLLKEDTVPSTIILNRANIVGGIYDKYGLNILPSSPSVPVNIFNLFAATGPVFKNNANVYVNGEFNANAINMLMYDSVKDKRSFFEEYTSPDITLKISVNPNELLGNTLFNTIELLPFIPGSFDIKAIRFQSLQDYRAESSSPSTVVSNTMPNVGASCVILDKGIELYSCEIDVHINFKNAAGKYPFGLKHIYFLNKNYNKESYVIIKVSKDSYIDWISDNITIHDQKGVRTTSCSQENIQAYARYKNNVLDMEIPFTRGTTQNSISRNIRDFYLKMPIQTSLTSIRLKQIGLR
nr:MAG TPA: hypothetical protein [Caudoviricetes sp.]